MLTLCRSKFDSRDRRDFSVLHNEKLIGGIYSGGPQGEKWWYALSGRASAPADSLEHAKMKLKAEWMLEQVAERCVELAQKCQNKKAERILRLLAVDLLLETQNLHRR